MKPKKRSEVVAVVTRVLGVISLWSSGVQSRAHSHKVHNLALYPERHSWCQSEKIRQEISAHNQDCRAVTIDNVVCLGACFSYSVPRSQDDAVIAPYCDACRPIQSSWTTVALECTKPDTLERYHVVRNVELIANCSCADCSNPATHQEGHDTSDDTESEELLESDEADAIDLEEDIEPDPSHLDVPILHKLKSASAEFKGVPKATEELMIKDNKISPDDDHNDEKI